MRENPEWKKKEDDERIAEEKRLAEEKKKVEKEAKKKKEQERAKTIETIKQELIFLGATPMSEYEFSNNDEYISAKCSNEEAYLFQKLIRTGFNRIMSITAHVFVMPLLLQHY